MNASAPNLPSFGTHCFDVKNDSPAARKAGHALLTVVTAMSTRMTGIASPARRLAIRNASSATRPRDRVARLGSDDKRFQLRDRQRAVLRRQLGVVGRFVKRLPVRLEVVQE